MVSSTPSAPPAQQPGDLRRFDNRARILLGSRPGAASGIWLEKPLRVPWKCPGPCPAGEPRLSTARSCARGAAPARGQPRARGGAGAAPPGTAPRRFPAAVVPSANLSGSTKVVFPALLEGPRPPMLLLPRPAAPAAPGRARRPPGWEDTGPCPAEFQSSLETFGVLFSGRICMNLEFPFGMYETSAGVTPTGSVRGESSALLKPLGHLDVSELMENKFARVPCFIPGCPT